MEARNNAAPGVEYHLVLTSSPGRAFSEAPTDECTGTDLKDSESLSDPMKMRGPYIRPQNARPGALERNSSRVYKYLSNGILVTFRS